MAELQAGQREQIKGKHFAIPPDRYPIHDLAHARNALVRVRQHGTPEEKSKVYSAVSKKYPALSTRSEVVPEKKQRAAEKKLGLEKGEESQKMEKAKQKLGSAMFSAMVDEVNQIKLARQPALMELAEIGVPAALAGRTAESRGSGALRGAAVGAPISAGLGVLNARELGLRGRALGLAAIPSALVGGALGAGAGALAVKEKTSAPRNGKAIRRIANWMVQRPAGKPLKSDLLSKLKKTSASKTKMVAQELKGFKSLLDRPGTGKAVVDFGKYKTKTPGTPIKRLLEAGFHRSAP